MSITQWITIISFCVVIVASLLSIHFSRQATRNWKRAEAAWKETADIYRKGTP